MIIAQIDFFYADTLFKLLKDFCDIFVRLTENHNEFENICKEYVAKHKA